MPTVTQVADKEIQSSSLVGLHFWEDTLKLL